jgi:hypothetical protein
VLVLSGTIWKEEELVHINLLASRFGQTCDVKIPPNAKEVLFRDGQCTNNAKIIALSV